MLEVLAPVLYYLFVFAGSITLGYLVLRVSYAEVRTFSKEERLGLAAVLGMVVALLSFISDAIISSPANFLAVKGYTMLLMFAWVDVFFLALKLHFHRTRKFVTVGVPLGRPSLKPLRPPSESKAEVAQSAPVTSLEEIAALKPQEKKPEEEIAEALKP